MQQPYFLNRRLCCVLATWLEYKWNRRWREKEKNLAQVYLFIPARWFFHILLLLLSIFNRIVINAKSSNNLQKNQTREKRTSAEKLVQQVLRLSLSLCSLEGSELIRIIIIGVVGRCHLVSMCLWNAAYLLSLKYL